MPAETHVERSPIGPDEVLRMIRERLAEILEIDEDAHHARLDVHRAISTPTRSRSIELVEALEEELGERTVGLQHRRRRPRRSAHVRDAVDYVVARLGSGAEPAGGSA